MELRTVDPRKLKANPNNPRRTAASPQADVQLLASVQARGIIQPPLVKITGTTGKNVDVLTIDAGHRRVAAAVKAGLKDILVLVEDAADLLVCDGGGPHQAEAECQAGEVRRR